jgi:hypothetical protein
MAEQWNYDLMAHRGAGEALYVDGKPASASQQRQYDRAWGRISSAIRVAGEEGRDVAASSVIPGAL